MSDDEVPTRSGRSSKGRKSSKKVDNDDMTLSDEPLGDKSHAQDHESAFHSSGSSVVIEGVDMDQPEHVSSMRKRAFDDEDTIEEQAEVVTTILWPVGITMILSIIVVKILSQGNDFVSNSLAFAENSDQSGGQRFLFSLLNAIIFVAVILVITVLFVILYKYRCLKVIYGWLILSTVLLLGFFGGLLSWEIVNQLNFAIDWFTMAIVVWNFSIVGIISIFWHASMRLNQLYLVAVSVIMAVVFTRLPEWTTWLILAAIAIYDLFAVLTPCGPLKKLVETAQERNETIPALVFHTSIWLTMAVGDEDENGQQKQDKRNSHVEGEEEDALIDEDDEEEQEEDKKRGVKLGLGDFVFYSVLVGRAALFDILTVFTTFVAVITGLFFTILLLAVWRKALPALPFSIFFGILFFFGSRFFLFPFASELAIRGVVV